MKIKSTGLNFLVMIFMQGSAYLIPLLINPYVSHIFQPSGMGIISYSYTIISYFVMVVMLGIPTYGMRECAKYRDDKQHLTQTAIEIFLMNIVILAFVLMVFFMVIQSPVLNQYKVVLLCMSPALVLNVISFDWLYKAKEDFVSIGVRNFFVKIVTLVLIFTLVKNEKDIHRYALLLVISAYGYALINFCHVWKNFSFREIGRLHIFSHLKPTLVFFAMTVSTTIYTNLDTLMIGTILGDYETGIYDAALKLKVILSIGVSSLPYVLLPKSTALFHEKGNEEFMKICSKSFNITVILVFLGITVCCFFSDILITIFSGKEFLAASPVLRLLSLTSLFIGCTSVIGIQILIPIGEESKVLISTVVGAVVDLCLNLVLIPRLGIIGAAWGTLFAEIAVFCVQIMYSGKYVQVLFKNLRYIISISFYKG